ncbi:MAG TPA: porin family protein [Pyrinomonadaceae bacterium]|jgi:opacity protein-like surface antigen
MSKQSKHLRSLSNGLRRASAIALVFLMTVPALATPTDICLPDITGGLTTVPFLDGIIEPVPGTIETNDAGWEGAARVNLVDNANGNIGTFAAANMQAAWSAGFLYLGFIVTTPQPNANTTIVVGFSTTQEGPADDWRLHIKPFTVAAAAATNVPTTAPDSVSWWRDSASWNMVGAAEHVVVPGEWPLANTRYTKAGNTWQVEMKIPITTVAADADEDTAVFVPATGVFKLYANVLSVSSAAATTTQDPWPAGVIVQPINGTFLTRNTPAVSLWGDASLNSRAACDGVSLAWNQIGVDDPANSGTLIHNMRRYDPPGMPTFTETETQCKNLAPDHQWPMAQGPVNTFVAKPLNGMVGTQAQVSATFRLANWGIPGTTEWTKLGEANPPLAPLVPPDVTTNPSVQQAINSGAQGNLTSTWKLSYRWSCLYFHRPHQCMQVDLSSNDPNTRFSDKSAQRNMDFVPASRFERRARISGNQGELPPGRTMHQFQIAVETDEQGRLENRRDDNRPNYSVSRPDRNPTRRFKSKVLADEAVKRFGSRATNFASWIARGSLKTGKTININGTEYEYVKRVGDFGYVAGHTGGITDWRFDFTGNNLQRLADNLYTIDVPPGGEAFVNTVIETIDVVGGGGGGGSIPADADSKRWGLSLHAGMSIPHSDFNDIFNPGPNFGVDLEYRLNNHLSLEALYGFHRFRGETFGGFSVDDLNLHQLSGNLKGYGGSGSVRPFLNGGGGVYHFRFGSFGSDTRGGINVGGGLQFNLTPTFAVEGSYNFHNVFTSGSDLKFSTLQGGVRFRF